MTVVKSFELKGNKLSFANWISNLSPTSTPFTSMIGKEAIDQTQYSWQTDSLAPASAETFEEGSQATLQPRASTNVFTNFTSLVRRAVRVSDTNESTRAYGREDEMAYQMGMAGKAVLRDIEYMNLSSRRGHAGTADFASAHSGFKDLCAPMFMPDPDTFALTHQGIAVVDETKPWFALKDIFKVTTELFLAGSRADKIMFHPKHINIFSDQIGYNEEEPLIYRLFDGMDPRYNANVSKIKDSVGRVYTLIPNRWMPENQVYIFSENDWTQMVLQQPVRKALARKGSAKSVYIETEVGLRHKHPYASGVLELVVVNYKGSLSLSKEKMTAFIEDTAVLTFTATDKAGAAASGVKAQISPTLDIGLAFEKTQFDTAVDGTDSTRVFARHPRKSVIYAFHNEPGKDVITNPITVEVVPPDVEFKVTGKVQAFKNHHIDFVVTDAQGNPVPDNTMLHISADEGLELVGPTSSDVDLVAGKGTFGIFPKTVGKVHLRAAFEDTPDAWKTYPFELDIEDNDFRLEFDKDIKTVITQSLATNPTDIPVTLFDDVTEMVGEIVTFKSLNNQVVSFESNEYTTDANGIATAKMAINGVGETQIVASFQNKAVSLHIRVGAGSAVLTLSKSVVEIGDPSEIIASLQLFEADGSLAKVGGIDVTWGSEPSNMEFDFEQPMTATNQEGIATNKIEIKHLVTKGVIKADWVDAGEFGEAPFEVIRTQYKAKFDHKEFTIVGGDVHEYEVPAKVVHDQGWADLGQHELKFSTADLGVADWKTTKGTTGADGYVTPTNSIFSGDFGTTTLTIKGTDTDTEVCEADTMVVHAIKPVVSFTSDNHEMLVGDTGTATITLEVPTGEIITGFRGDLTILVNDEVLTLASPTVTFNSSKATLDFSARALGSSEIRFALANGVELPVKGNNLVNVTHPGLRVTTNPDTYHTGESVHVKAILTKPSTSSANLEGREITLNIVPDTLTGLTGERKSTTDSTGTATFSSAAITGNSDYAITASFNGISETYDLVCETV